MSDPVQVSVDDQLTALAVHWNTGLADARLQFEQWGFRGIEGFKKIAVLNGNAARTRVRDTVLSRKGDWRYFWMGSYDWGVTADSAIYQFGYDAYVGSDTVSGPDAKWMANWTAPTEPAPAPKEEKE